MRKLLFLFVVTMLSVTAMAQDVIYDKTNDAGVRTVVCSGMDLGVSNGMNVYVALAGFQYKSTIRYSGKTSRDYITVSHTFSSL